MSPPPVYDNALRARSAKFMEVSKLRVERDVPTQKESVKRRNIGKACFEIYQDEPSMMKRLALSWAYALAHEPIYLQDDDLLVGQLYFAPTINRQEEPRWADFDYGPLYDERIRKELPELFPLLGQESPDAERSPVSWISLYSCASTGHIGWHWDWIVKDGVEGMFKRLDAAMPNVDAKGREVLEAMRISLQGLLDMNAAHIQALEVRLASARGDAKAALAEKLEICRQVPLRGARNFREAAQAQHISYLATWFENGGNGAGRLDYHLWPYLERDLASGKETLESARLLVDELFMRTHERYLWSMEGAGETIVVAGSHPDGSSAANPLSKIMVESIGSLKIVHPAVYIRLPEHPPEWLLSLSAAHLVQGNNLGQVNSDKAVVEAMTRDGHVPKEHAYMYMCGGCMEASPQGMNGDLNFADFFSVAKVLEYVLTGGVCMMSGKRLFLHLEKTLADFVSFEELYAAFRLELERCLLVNFKMIDISAECMRQRRLSTMLSCQIEDCIARGRIINDGGAVYEDYGAAPLGIPNASDTLFALKAAVFDGRFVTGDELLEALARNFEGNEMLRRRLLALPKFGQENPEADAMAKRVVEDVCAVFESYTNVCGGKVKPMIMTSGLAPKIGATLGATADGRLAGTPIAQGITPKSSAMTEGITAAMNSAVRMPVERFSGGASHMWDLDHQFATPEVVDGLLRTFFAAGGQMFQGNMTDVEVLKQAQGKPEDYPNLMVRVGGYSDKFTKLDKAGQNELITRIRHRR
ncbi:MAG: pyruvate formate lyase family protein [Verrucomicrobiae bacterium]